MRLLWLHWQGMHGPSGLACIICLKRNGAAPSPACLQGVPPAPQEPGRQGGEEVGAPDPAGERRRPEARISGRPCVAAQRARWCAAAGRIAGQASIPLIGAPVRNLPVLCAGPGVPAQPPAARGARRPQVRPQLAWVFCGCRLAAPGYRQQAGWLRTLADTAAARVCLARFAVAASLLCSLAPLTLLPPARLDKIYINGHSGEIKIGDLGLAVLAPRRFAPGASCRLLLGRLPWRYCTVFADQPSLPDPISRGCLAGAEVRYRRNASTAPVAAFLTCGSLPSPQA